MPHMSSLTRGAPCRAGSNALASSSAVRINGSSQGAAAERPPAAAARRRSRRAAGQAVCMAKRSGAEEAERGSRAPQGSMDIDVFETAGTSADPSPRGDAATPSPLAAFVAALDFSEPVSFDGEEKEEFDPLRDGPLRYLGYANELGEAFAAWLFNGGVPLSYAVAIGYVLFDTWDKYQKTLADAQAKLGARALPAGVDRQRLISTIGFERGLDTLAWQLIASVAAPGYTIHSVVALANLGLSTAEKSAPVMDGINGLAASLSLSSDAFLLTFNKSVPTAVGLLAIPFIVHPIDAAVHAALNATLRPLLRRYICSDAGGAQAGLPICRDCEL